MRPLTATDVLRIWELGERQGPVDQALTMLGVACPELTAEQLADLSLGQRDRRLFALHERLFGPNLHGFAECPQCRQRLEFAWQVPATDDTDAVEPTNQWQTFSAHGFELCFRLPNSRDLNAAAACSDSQQARQILIQLCLQEAYSEGASVNATELPEPVVAELATHLTQCDPWQEVLMDIACAACGYRWQPLLDIVTFLWAQWAALAKRLLREVHTLARAYGWSESDILAMNARRRQSYLELVGT